MFFKKNKIKFNQYWLFTFLIASILMLPSILQKGMFLDGVTYAAISKNLAHDIGTFFKPVYTQTILNPFYEHPPFVFWLQSVFFKIFGDTYLIEKVYSLITVLFTGWGIILLLNFFFKEKKHNWFVIFIWITIPTIFWAYTHNILENTLGVFTIFSVYFLINFIQTNKIKFLLFGSLFIVIAFLCKGFVGLFPLAVPVLYSVIQRKELKKMFFINSKLLLVFISLSFVLLFFFQDLKENLIHYIETQLIPSIEGNREITVSYRLKIILDLIIELSFPMVILIISFFASKKKKFTLKKESLFFLLIGISASLPLIISMKQRKFYLVPSFPFYIIGLCLLILPLVEPKLNSLYEERKNMVKGLNIALFMLIMFFAFKSNGFLRDKNQIEDIQKITNILKEGTIISTSKSFKNDWQTIAYFSREKFISLTDKKGNDFYLKRKKENLEKSITKKVTEINLNLVEYNLYKINNEL